MKRFVNGVEVELNDDGSTQIQMLPDRLAVRSESGVATAIAVLSGDATLVSYRGRQYRIEKSSSRRQGHRAAESGEIFAPMPGVIADILVEVGEAVEDGQKLLVLEAMKTHQAFVSPFAGKVKDLRVSAGAQVQEGETLIILEPNPLPGN